LIPIIDDLSPIKQQRNTKLKTQQWKRKLEDLPLEKIKTKSPYNQRTLDLTWFDNVPTSTRRRGEIFIENREENTRCTKRSLSHTQLSIVKI